MNRLPKEIPSLQARSIVTALAVSTSLGVLTTTPMFAARATNAPIFVAQANDSSSSLRIQPNLPPAQAPAQAQTPIPTPTREAAEVDMEQIVQSTPLLTAEFEAVYDKEKALDRSTEKAITQYKKSERKGSDRAPRFGSNIVEFNHLWRESARCDALYSQYLTACSNHFRQYHRPDLEMAIRSSPCGLTVLNTMGDDYAKLHHAVLKAHSERLKLLAVENSLRTAVGVALPLPSETDRAELGTAGASTNRSVEGRVLPADR